ncbi:MAG: hypothetical protein IKJ77_01830 [Firmicutes bacterium]|nr:hypothetical protein [Bacillota bacterium]
MITKYKYQPTIPYSLHDMVVNEITYNDDEIHLRFDQGYVSLKEPYSRVGGSITIQGVDFDFVAVMLLNKNGTYGEFKGCKLSLNEFLEKYDTYEFEIVDEMYGYNSVEYSGFLSAPYHDDFIEMILSIYHFGDIVYETDE